MLSIGEFTFPLALPMAVFALATINGEFGVHELVRPREFAHFVLAWIAVAGMLGLCLITATPQMLLWALPGWLLADVFSGLFHFLGDTLRLPSFWEHHTDPMIMTHHTFLFRNAEIFALGAIAHPLVTAYAPALKPLLDITVMLAMFSNETHRWAHLRRVGKPVPVLVQKLQNWGLILTPERHSRHHRGTFNTHFSIFAGVSDFILGKPCTAIHDYFHPPEGPGHPKSARSSSK